MRNSNQTLLINVTTSETNNGIILGQFGLRAVGSTGGASAVDGLRSEALSNIVQAGFDSWDARGLSDDLFARLTTVEFHVSDLPAAYLGHVADSVVWIDRDAAGYGWFIDPTPWDDEEFDEDGRAIVGGAADGRVDLLTVVMHELGHVLGLGHDDDPDSLMYDLLVPGVRRRISADDIDALFAAWDEE